MSIVLIDDTDGQVTYQEEKRDLKASGNFLTALVSKGTWIFYKEKNFNDASSGGTERDIMVLDESKRVKQDISGHNGSMYLVSDDTDALVLFKHVNYGGVDPDPKTYTEAVYNDITKDFPPNNPAGASSARVVGNEHDWELYTNLNCVGGAHTLKRDHNYPNFVSLKINDKIKSLQKK